MIVNYNTLLYFYQTAQENVPSFRLTKCAADGNLCINVTFVDGERDMIVANEYHSERHPSHDVFKGKLKSGTSNAKVVILLSQENEVKDLITFKSRKVPGCRKYRVSLKVNIYAMGFMV